ncbi:MAG TPA: AarF/UbiB family protein, partial [Acidimicrobiales bacterium]
MTLTPPSPTPPSLTRFGVREVVRGAEIWTVLLFHVARALARHTARHPRAAFRARRDPEARRALGAAASAALVEAFVALGPTFVKLGQMIASSPGMFPEVLADACLRTLDDVPPFPADEVLRIVEDDLGAAAGEVFASFDREPLSAASIAQVHGCVLRDGRAAVVKVQRPRIADRMNRDLRIMYRIARVVDR